jgi:glycolate oxidase iron-sulfur subunit
VIASTEQFLDEDKALSCIHCGLCLSSCPTYFETGNENDSPRGRIYLMRALQDGRLPLEETVVTHIDRCLGCRACEAVCPSGVEYGDLLEHTRDHIERDYKRSPFQTLLRRVFIEQIFPYTSRMELALKPVRWLRQLGIDRWLPGFAKEAMDLVPDDYEAVTLAESNPTRIRPSRGKVGFVSGCVMSAMLGKTNQASVALLNRAGFDVIVPQNQSCCGALYAHSGQLTDARKVARENIMAFREAGCDTIVINAAGCGSTLKEYGNLLRDDPAWAEAGNRFSGQVRDLTEFLVEQGFAEQVRAEAKKRAAPLSGKRVTFHDACHLAHPQGITAAPRQLVVAVAGEQFVPLPESDVCCGSAGSYNLTEPEMAKRLQDRKMNNIYKTKAEVVVTTNPGCILQMQSGVKSNGNSEVRVMHIADYLNETLGLTE